MRLPPIAICGVTTAAADDPEGAALVVLMPEAAAYAMSRHEAEGAVRSAFTAEETSKVAAWIRVCARPVLVFTNGQGLTVGELRGAWFVGAKGGEA